MPPTDDELPEHEHDSGCWPGGESDMSCPVTFTLAEAEEVLTELLEWARQRLEGRKASVWGKAQRVRNAARVALKPS